MPTQTNHLAVCADDLGLEIKQALRRAGALGFRAVDIGATAGAVSPRSLSQSGRKHLLRYVGDLGLRVAGLRGPVSGASYADGAAGERRLDTMRSIIAMAGDLRVPVVSTAIGGQTQDSEDEQASHIREALRQIASDADRCGVNVAIETVGIETESLHRMLADLNCPWVGAACDSGAMLMRGEDPHRVADHLAGRIKIVRARDAIAGTPAASGRETAWGEGHLDVPAFLAALQEAGFDGDFILTRTEGAKPDADLFEAKSALTPLLALR